MEPDAVEIRVLGCLLEKQRTTPDVYPLSLNSLRLACNQTTSREPVVDYDETTIRDALTRLSNRRWTRLASASRTVKYRHLLDEALGLGRDEIAPLCVMMLRGPQTLNELKTRTARLHEFADDEALRATLERLIAREFVQLMERQPGQKEQRYRQLLGGGDDAPPSTTDGANAAATELESTRAELAATQAELAELRAELAAAQAELAALREDRGA